MLILSPQLYNSKINEPTLTAIQGSHSTGKHGKMGKIEAVLENVLEMS